MRFPRNFAAWRPIDAGPAFDACIRAIAAAQYLVEPGAPSVSNLMTR
jgi:hypothetical protein